MNSVIEAITAPCDRLLALGKLSDRPADQVRTLQSQEPWLPGRSSPGGGLGSDGACHGTERSKAGTVANSGASAMRVEPPGRYCGRQFSAADLAHIRELLQIKPALSRVALSRRLCLDLGWLNALGRPKEMSCRVALLRMEKDGWIRLPEPSGKWLQARRPIQLTWASDPCEPVREGSHALQPLVFQKVAGQSLSNLWNELIQRYHYLGYSPLSGAQMRYLVWSADRRLLATLGFGASAWQLKARDQYIGWDDRQRRAGLHRIVNNARFLILPWVQSAGLASGILSGILQPLCTDWRLRYGYEPVLLESFVEIPRYTGASYRAANWIKLGQTQGRGKLEKNNCQVVPLKEIWVYAVHPAFRDILRAPS
jgi:Druantia protein DruA